MDVTIVQRPKQLMNPFDADMASFIHAEARKHGVKLALGYTVEGFEEKDGGVDVLLKDERSPSCGYGGAGHRHHAGHRSCERSWSGTGDQGQYRGQRPDGDICAGHLCRGRCGTGEALSSPGEDALISLAGPANKQGRIIADNICGGDSRYLGSQGSSVIKVFDITAATTGINETNAKKAGLDVDKVYPVPHEPRGLLPRRES